VAKVSFVIDAIRCLHAIAQKVGNPWFSNFPRNLAPDFGQYTREWPEMTSHGGKPRKAKTMKGNNTYENKIS